MNEGDFDFEAAEQERPFTEHFARVEALAAEEFSEINLCLTWMFRCDGRNWRDWFDNQPKYAQLSMLNTYRAERWSNSNDAMRPYSVVSALLEEALKQEEEITDRWAFEIRQAAINRKPIPYGPGDLEGFELLKFEHRLWMACNKAGIIPIQEKEEVVA